MSPKNPTIRAEAQSVPGSPPHQKAEFDILEMPLEGLAAYWLSIKKLVDLKKNRQFLADEAEYTEEPFVRYLLDAGFSDLPEAMVLDLAKVRRDQALSAWGLKFELMAAAFEGMASNENPRLTLIRMLHRFAAPPITEEKAVELAQGVLRSLSDPNAERRTLLPVDHKMQLDRLLVKLLFYCMYVRREGATSLGTFLPYLTSYYFIEGARLVMDGFEPSFLRERLGELKAALLDQAGLKMDMSIHMLSGIRARLAYEDVYRIARAYLP
jgi:hypothetical protein